MLRNFVGTLFLAALLLTACDTINLGGGGPGRGPEVGTITVPTGLFAQNDGDFSVSWTGGTAPYTIEWNFGGGADPDTVAPATATSPNSQTVTLSDNAGGTFTVTVTVTDADNEEGSSSASYTYGPVQNAKPVLTAAGAGTDAITISCTDADNDDVVVTVTSPAGLLADAASKTVTGGNGDVTFNFSAEDLFAGGSGDASFVGNDGTQDSDAVTANVVVPTFGPIADTLFAIPLVASALTTDTVSIVVATGVPANAFQYMNGCRVTAPTGFAYVDGTFNVGAPGGAAGDADGFWTTMAPGGGFLLPPDNFIVETDLGGGLVGIDFNVTPIGGSDVTTDSGALFNFGATFAAGENVLGFQQTLGVDRTYYTDMNAGPNRFWGDITNDHAGVRNSVTITAP